MEPEIVYLIACDDVTMDPQNLHRITPHGLLIRMWATGDPPFPLTRPDFCVLAIFHGGQGTFDVSVRVIYSPTGHIVIRTPAHRIRFAGSPGGVSGARFRLRGCTFPAAGLYWVECLAGATIIGRQRLWILDRRATP